MKPKKNINFWSRAIYSSIFSIVLILVLIFIGYSIYQKKINQQNVDKRLDHLREEIQRLQDTNLELAEMIKYLRTDEYIETQARENLNLKRSGEKVVIISNEDNNTTKKNDSQQNKPNYILWFEYFFR